MADREFLTHSTDETIALGHKIAAELKAPVLVLLSGDLGAGKTTLTKGIASGLGAAKEEDVTSPTFTLVHKYEGKTRVYHVDLYRIGDAHDFETLGLEDVFSEQAIVLVEWPERMPPVRTGWPIVRIHLEHVDEETRRIQIADALTEGASARGA
ncbi:MAG TPA: tRNA (adenosine(37)-N6)-threonylcarbamoyltransferase complex ATPase subunit type 1 TsaE [Candidatus Acidoferrales bacterium]|nr:tRNA (adenosine(37)-N6)-threonylcarbamoyltransferase complex ATPase subunit type 1 TsaE [Candidatus Acidoferrales bacterium]